MVGGCSTSILEYWQPENLINAHASQLLVLYCSESRMEAFVHECHETIWV
jgi:hypothetical protein